VEAVSRLEAILREDPSGIYTRSDFGTRDRCRRSVEQSARQSKRSEWDVASLVVQLAQQGSPGSRENCVAFYLLDEGLAELESSIGRRIAWRERGLRFLYRHPAMVYLGIMSILTAGIVSTFLATAHAMGVRSPLMLLLLGVIALFPASELALYTLQML